MVRSEFIDKVAHDAGISHVKAVEWTNAVLDSLADALVTEDELKLYKIGVFAHKRRAPRIGRNAATGEPIDIPARTVVKFTPSAAIVGAVRDVPVPEQ